MPKSHTSKPHNFLTITDFTACTTLILIDSQSQSVCDAAKKKPHLKVMCGFSRRFDRSYRDAWNKMDTGVIGRPSVFRSQTCDKLDPSGFFVQYAEFSGGIFVDCSIHDIDLCLWFFGNDSRVKSVSAIGITAVEPGLAQHKDVDNGVGIIEFYGGQMAFLYCSRMMAAGQEDVTEIIGTQGKLAVNAYAALNRVQHYSGQGVQRDMNATYYDEFYEAFALEAKEFTDACLDDTKLPMKLQGAVQAVAIGCALQESVYTGKKIWFNEKGEREERSSL